MVDIAKCPLCNDSADRATLPSGNGYLYDCASCGGKFEMGTGAYGRAARGQLHAEIPAKVRELIHAGGIPRIEFEAGSGTFRIIPDVLRK